MACETSQKKTAHKERENCKVQDVRRQEGTGECVWNPGKQVQGTTGHNGAKAQGYQKH